MEPSSRLSNLNKEKILYRYCCLVASPSLALPGHACGREAHPVALAVPLVAHAQRPLPRPPAAGLSAAPPGSPAPRTQLLGLRGAHLQAGCSGPVLKCPRWAARGPPGSSGALPVLSVPPHLSRNEAGQVHDWVEGVGSSCLPSRRGDQDVGPLPAAPPGHQDPWRTETFPLLELRATLLPPNTRTLGPWPLDARTWTGHSQHPGSLACRLGPGVRRTSSPVPTAHMLASLSPD